MKRRFVVASPIQPLLILPPPIACSARLRAKLMSFPAPARASVYKPSWPLQPPPLLHPRQPGARGGAMDPPGPPARRQVSTASGLTAHHLAIAGGLSLDEYMATLKARERDREAMKVAVLDAGTAPGEKMHIRCEYILKWCGNAAALRL